MPATLTPTPAFADNYIWWWQRDRQAVAVDAGDPGPLLAALAAQELRLAALLITHHHPDHTGGIAALRDRFPGLRVIGPAAERIDGLSETVRGGDRLELLGERLQVLDLPGHTLGHIGFFMPAPQDGSAPLLLCGDTLFGAGCGRLFEGSPAQLLASLQQLAALPPETRVACTHEYTLANLRFARHLEPEHAGLAARERDAQALRAAGRPTLPSSVALERATNPFLRCAEPALWQAALRAPQPPQTPDALAVFTALRQWKNQF